MTRSCSKKIRLFVVVVGFLSFTIQAKSVYAVVCGNGVCQASHNEDCNTCPADCGTCLTPTPTPTPNPTPTPGPTPTPSPSSTSTPTPGDDTSSGSESATTNNPPSISITNSPGNITNQSAFIVGGTVSSENSTVNKAEYSLNGGNTWNEISLTNNQFTFSVSLEDGNYTITIRATDLTGTSTSENLNITIASQPPEININPISGPTDEQEPTISGSFTSSYSTITRVQYSLDGGLNWSSISFSQSGFSHKIPKLEDGNYSLIVRLFDNAGNLISTDPQTLIIDTIPPIIGGGQYVLGPLTLKPSSNGKVHLVIGAESKYILSMKGGATEAKITTLSESFDLTNQPGSNLWYGKINFVNSEEKEITISAIDGAGNKTDRVVGVVSVEESGKILDKNNEPIENATVTLYYYQPSSKDWFLWNGESFGQTNSQITNSNGEYSFMAPAGKYYLEINAPGYKKMQSEIIETEETKVLNFIFTLNKRPSFMIKLPIFGEVLLTVPTFIPDTIDTNSLKKPDELENKTASNFPIGSLAPEITLLNLSNEEVKLSSYRGKKLFLTFFSPWSTLSLEQVSVLSDLSDELNDNQSLVVISVQESVAKTNAFMKRGNYKFDVLADENGESATKYQISILPQHFLIDENGNIREIVNGVLNKDEVLAKLN